MNNLYYPSAIAIGHLCADTICVLDGFPQENTSIHIREVDKQSGGGASQAIVAYSRLGGKSGYIGVLGSDPVGEYVFSEIRKENVDTSFVQWAEGRSAFSFVFINSNNASRTLFNYHENVPPINFNLKLEDYIAHSAYIHLDGTMFENAYNAAVLAKKLRIKVSLDGSSMQKDNKQNIKLAKMADILIMNELYPCRLMEDENRERALLEIAKFGAEVVISTSGEKGCLLVDQGVVKKYPAFNITPLDTTGAGDVFHGGFLRAMDLGYNLDHSIRFASAVSAINCLSIGGRKGIPTLQETLEFINENNF